MEINFIPSDNHFKVQIKKSGNLIGEFAITLLRNGKVKVVIGKNSNNEEIKIEKKKYGSHDLPKLSALPTSYTVRNFIVKIDKYGSRYKLFILTKNGGYKGRILIYQNELIHINVDDNFDIQFPEEFLKEMLHRFTEMRAPRPVDEKGLPKKPPREYDLDALRDDKEKWIKWYLSMIKNTPEHKHKSYEEIMRHILRNDGEIESRTICHDKLEDEPDFNDEKAWRLCGKVWLLIMTNRKYAWSLAKKLDKENYVPDTNVPKTTKKRRNK